MTTVSRNMIIRDQDYDNADKLAKACAGTPGAGMWGEGQRTSATGSLPAEMRITSGPIPSEFADLLPLTTFDAQGNASTRSGNAATIVAMAAAKGVIVDVAVVQDLLDNSDVTDVAQVDPHVRLAALGQKIVQAQPPN